MQRRSRSKLSLKQSSPERPKSLPKAHKTEKRNSNSLQQNYSEKKLRQNILISLVNICMESQNDPSLIHPWMDQFKQLETRIIGTNYIVIGPSQSGKYSAVKYALGQHNKNLHEIHINCDINTTQPQFFKKLLEEFKLISPKWNVDQSKMELNKIITSDNINFSSLNPFIEKTKIKFVIVIKNGHHLVGFRKQTILYSLFEWMSSKDIQDKGGLVILTRQLRFTDRFQKRIKSRFCGNRICIYRPQKAEIYIQILIKRIEAVIKDKQVWAHNLKYQNPQMENENQQVYYSDDDRNIRKTKSKFLKKIQQKKEEISDIEEILDNVENHPYIKSLNEYFISLKYYFTNDQWTDFGISNFFRQKLMELNRSKNKRKEMKLFSQQSVLSPREQLECLCKLKEAIQNNKELNNYIQSEIDQYMPLTIPLMLQKFQIIFIKLDENMIKLFPVKILKKIIAKMLKESIKKEYPDNETENDCLQSNFQFIQDFNNVELLILILILEFMDKKQNLINLSHIYKRYKFTLNSQINQNCERISNKFPLKIIQISIDRLYRANVISYDPHNIWHSAIYLKLQIVKIKLGLKQLAKKRQLIQIFIDKVKDLNIMSAAEGEIENYEINLSKNSK